VVLPTHDVETTMQIPYGPRGLHTELESRFDRLVTERRTRRTRRTGRSDPR
jgi:hypothetical protein